MLGPRALGSAALFCLLALWLLALTSAAPAQVQAPPTAVPPATPPPAAVPPAAPPPAVPAVPVTPPAPVTPAPPPPAAPETPAPAPPEPPAVPEPSLPEEPGAEESPPAEPGPGGPTEPGRGGPAEPGPGGPAGPTEPGGNPAEPGPTEPGPEDPLAPEEPVGLVPEEPEIDPVTGMPVGTPGFETSRTGARGPAAGGGKSLGTIGLPNLSSVQTVEEPETVGPPPSSDSGNPISSPTPSFLPPGGSTVGAAVPGALQNTSPRDRRASAGGLFAPAPGSAGGDGGSILATPPLAPETAESVVSGPLAGAVGLVAGAVGGGGAADAGGSGGRSGAGGPGLGGGGGGAEKNAGFLAPIDPATFIGDGFNDLLIGIPSWVWILLAVLAGLSLLLALAYLLATLRARSLGRQRRELLQEVGLLQSALLPPVPDKLGGLRTSVAYRPADGPGAGGDFYDVLPLAGGAVGFILGDVSGHGRGALARTAFMRYTLRAYLEAGLEPRVALQVAGRVIDENLGGDFATVLLAVHDPKTGSLTYATAGHPSPIVIGPQPHEPVTAGSSPPIGVGVKTGLRQTTLPLVPGATAALFTDGLMEARVDGVMLGRERLEVLLAELGDQATARGLIDRVAEETGKLSDDIAAVVVAPTVAAAGATVRTEQLELTNAELQGDMAERFLASCGVAEADAAGAIEDARVLGERFGGAIMRVVFADPMRVDVFPSNVETIEAASRRSAAG